MNDDDQGSAEGLAEVTAATASQQPAEEPAAGPPNAAGGGPGTEGHPGNEDHPGNEGHPGSEDSPGAEGHPGSADPSGPEDGATAVQQPAAEPASKPRAPQRQDRRWSAWRELPVLIVVALAIALVIKSFVVQPFFIPSSSMENTLLIGDKVLVNKLVYHVRSIDRGDVIVFNGIGSWNPAPASNPSSDPIVRAYDATLRPLFRSIAGLFGTPADTGTDYIKRVIGLPGDRVACCTRGLLTVNGVPLHETSYVHPGEAPSLTRFSTTVPPGRLWVMGDNRAVSNDSRTHTNFPGAGSVPENEVVGRAFVIVWPPSRWQTLPIPSTFDQPALVKAAAAAAPYAPLAAGFGAAVPLTWLQRRVRYRVRNRLRRRPGGPRR